MAEKIIKEHLHSMRGSLSVVGNFIQFVNPNDDDTDEYKKIAINSLNKINTIVSELSDILKTEVFKEE